MQLIIARLKEPSTYAGLASVIMMGSAFIPNASAWAHEVTLIGAAITGLLAIILPETKK
jgi:hypothetical protein